MKTCPQCETGYPDSHTTCPVHGVLLNEIRDLKPGMVIRNIYRILRKLGQGGMGAVYLAQHTLMNEQQALKFLSSELSHDEAFTARFLREVRTLRQIRHKNVVDAGNLEPAEDGTLFFSMEFVDGPDLRVFLNNASYYSAQQLDSEAMYQGTASQLAEKLEIEPALYQGTASAVPKTQQNKARALAPEGALPVPLALSIARQIAEGLGAAHSKGMVHRDIKPENILMARDAGAWLPKIADFGIVATKESSTAYTRTGGTLLTMAYAAPEQWRGTPAAELDGRTDLYALGGLLYEMLTGQTAFQAENYEGWSRQHQTTPPQPPSALRPDLANWQGLDALTLRLLAKDRNDRPKDVAELLTLLDAVRYELLAPRPVTVVELPPMPVTTPSRFGIIKWVLAAILIVLGLGIWVAVRFSHSTAPVSTEDTQTAAQPSTISTPTANHPINPSSMVPAHVPGGGVNPAVQPGTITNPTSNAATLLVLCDLACNWKLDGKALGRLAAGDSVTAPLSLGQHMIDATTLDGLDKVKKEIVIKTTGQMNVHLALQSVQAARIKAAQEARDKADQEARDKAAQEQRAREQQERERVARELAAVAWTDSSTGLMWTKKDNGSNVNWQQAMGYCRNLQLAGHYDWRLPTINELQSIYDPDVDLGVWHVKGNLQLSGWHWSSTLGNDSGEVLYFFFRNGEHYSALRSFSNSTRVLCVRRSGE